MYSRSIPAPMKLSYFGIRVTDLERSLKFYTQLLGLKEVRRGEATEWGAGTWVLLKDEPSGQQLELNWYPPGSKYAVPYVPGEGLDHIAFLVDDVRKTFNELVAKGAAPTQVTPEETDGWTAYVKDPDGNWIEIYTHTTPPG